MPKVGDRVQVMSKKAGPRSGVVRRVAGALLTIEWESGEESTLIPGPGVLSVVGSGGRAPSARKAATKRPAPAPKTSAKKTAPKASSGAKKAAKKTSVAKSTAKKAGRKPAR